MGDDDDNEDGGRERTEPYVMDERDVCELQRVCTTCKEMYSAPLAPGGALAGLMSAYAECMAFVEFIRVQNKRSDPALGRVQYVMHLERHPLFGATLFDLPYVTTTSSEAAKAAATARHRAAVSILEEVSLLSLKLQQRPADGMDIDRRADRLLSYYTHSVALDATALSTAHLMAQTGRVLEALAYLRESHASLWVQHAQLCLLVANMVPVGGAHASDADTAHFRRVASSVERLYPTTWRCIGPRTLVGDRDGIDASDACDLSEASSSAEFEVRDAQAVHQDTVDAYIRRLSGNAPDESGVDSDEDDVFHDATTAPTGGVRWGMRSKPSSGKSVGVGKTALLVAGVKDGVVLKDILLIDDEAIKTQMKADATNFDPRNILLATRTLVKMLSPWMEKTSDAVRHAMYDLTDAAGWMKVDADKMMQDKFSICAYLIAFYEVMRVESTRAGTLVARSGLHVAYLAKLDERIRKYGITGTHEEMRARTKAVYDGDSKLKRQGATAFWWLMRCAIKGIAMRARHTDIHTAKFKMRSRCMAVYNELLYMVIVFKKLRDAEKRDANVNTYNAIDSSSVNVRTAEMTARFDDMKNHLAQGETVDFYMDWDELEAKAFLFRIACYNLIRVLWANKKGLLVDAFLLSEDGYLRSIYAPEAHGFIDMATPPSRPSLFVLQDEYVVEIANVAATFYTGAATSAVAVPTVNYNKIQTASREENLKKLAEAAKDAALNRLPPRYWSRDEIRSTGTRATLWCNIAFMASAGAIVVVDNALVETGMGLGGELVRLGALLSSAMLGRHTVFRFMSRIAGGMSSLFHAMFLMPAGSATDLDELAKLDGPALVSKLRSLPDGQRQAHREAAIFLQDGPNGSRYEEIVRAIEEIYIPHYRPLPVGVSVDDEKARIAASLAEMDKRLGPKFPSDVEAVFEKGEAVASEDIDNRFSARNVRHMLWHCVDWATDMSVAAMLTGGFTGRMLGDVVRNVVAFTKVTMGVWVARTAMGGLSVLTSSQAWMKSATAQLQDFLHNHTYIPAVLNSAFMIGVKTYAGAILLDGALYNVSALLAALFKVMDPATFRESAEMTMEQFRANMEIAMGDFAHTVAATMEESGSIDLGTSSIMQLLQPLVGDVTPLDYLKQTPSMWTAFLDNIRRLSCPLMSGTFCPDFSDTKMYALGTAALESDSLLRQGYAPTVLFVAAAAALLLAHATKRIALLQSVTVATTRVLDMSTRLIGAMTATARGAPTFEDLKSTQMHQTFTLRIAAQLRDIGLTRQLFERRSELATRAEAILTAVSEEQILTESAHNIFRTLMSGSSLMDKAAQVLQAARADPGVAAGAAAFVYTAMQFANNRTLPAAVRDTHGLDTMHLAMELYQDDAISAGGSKYGIDKRAFLQFAEQVRARIPLIVEETLDARITARLRTRSRHRRVADALAKLQWTEADLAAHVREYLFESRDMRLTDLVFAHESTKGGWRRSVPDLLVARAIAHHESKTLWASLTQLVTRGTWARPFAANSANMHAYYAPEALRISKIDKDFVEEALGHAAVRAREHLLSSELPEEYEERIARRVTELVPSNTAARKLHERVPGGQASFLHLARDRRRDAALDVPSVAPRATQVVVLEGKGARTRKRRGVGDGSFESALRSVFAEGRDMAGDLYVEARDTTKAIYGEGKQLVVDTVAGGKQLAVDTVAGARQALEDELWEEAPRTTFQYYVSDQYNMWMHGAVPPNPLQLKLIPSKILNAAGAAIDFWAWGWSLAQTGFYVTSAISILTVIIGKDGVAVAWERARGAPPVESQKAIAAAQKAAADAQKPRELTKDEWGRILDILRNREKRMGTLIDRHAEKHSLKDDPRSKALAKQLWDARKDYNTTMRAADQTDGRLAGTMQDASELEWKKVIKALEKERGGGYNRIRKENQIRRIEMDAIIFAKDVIASQTALGKFTETMGDLAVLAREAMSEALSIQPIRLASGLLQTSVHVARNQRQRRPVQSAADSAAGVGFAQNPFEESDDDAGGGGNDDDDHDDADSHTDDDAANSNPDDIHHRPQGGRTKPRVLQDAITAVPRLSPRLYTMESATKYYTRRILTGDVVARMALLASMNLQLWPLIVPVQKVFTAD